MTDPFATAIAVLHASPLAVAAEYLDHAGDLHPVRVIRTSTTADMDVGGVTVVAGTTLFEILRSAAPAPRAGDSITIGEEAFKVMGEPRLDVERVSWLLQAQPA